MATAISEEELKLEILAILRNVDLTTTSSKKVRNDLEQKLNCDLNDRKKEIAQVIEQYVADNHNAESSDDDSDEEEASDADDKQTSRKRSTAATAPRKPAAKKKKRNSSSVSTSDDDDDGGGSSDAPKPKPRKKPAAKSDGSTTKGGKAKVNSFTRPFKLSPELATLMGEESLPRHEVVRKVWALIKARNLYDPKNKQFAICDADLLTVIGVKRFRTFGMLKYLKKHFVE